EHNFSIEAANALYTVKKTVFFAIDTTAPTISITSPSNITYESNSVTLTYTVSEASSITVFLDDINKGVVLSGESLTDMSDGTHNLTIQAVDITGNIATSTVIFSIETLAPVITINSPLNTSISSDFLILDYIVSEEANTTVFLDMVPLGHIPSGDVISNLSEGSHNLTIQAVDGAGNIAIATIFFTTDYQNPIITITSPTNKSYNSNSVTLIYTVSEDANISVFLDSVDLGLIPSGGLLSGLSDGVHNLTIEAVDKSGNIGVTTTWFTSDDPSSTVITYPFTDRNIGYESWYDLPDVDMKEGELLFLNFTISGLSDSETYLEIVIDSPSSPNRVIEKLDYTDLQNYFSSGEVLSYLWYTDLNAGDIEGLTQFKFYVNGNIFASVKVTGVQYHCLNEFAVGTVDLEDYSIFSGSVPLEWSFSDVNMDSLSFNVYFKQNSWSYSYMDMTGFELIYSGSDSSILFDSTVFSDQNGLIAIVVFEHVNHEWMIYQVFYFKIYVDNVNDPPVLDVPSITQTDTSFQISYSASDFNKDDLVYSIFYAKDGVNFVHDLIINTTTQFYTWDVSGYPTGDKYAIKIIVTDEHESTDTYISPEYTIVGNEEIMFVGSVESVTSSESQTITVSINFEGFVELFNNGVSKGIQSTGLSWDIVLLEGLNNVTAVGTNEVGTKFRITKSIRLLKTAEGVEEVEAGTEDSGIIHWYIINRIGDNIGSLSFDYSIIANLTHDPIYNLEPGDSFVVQNIIRYGNCSITLTIIDLAETLESLLSPVLGDVFPLEILGETIDYNTISDAFEGDYCLDFNLRIGRNKLNLEFQIPIIEWDCVLTLEVDLSLFVQYGIKGNAIISDNDFIEYRNYGTKTVNFQVLNDAKKGDKVILKSFYRIALNNIGLYMSVVGDAVPNPLGSGNLLEAIDESGTIFESGPVSDIWQSSDNLFNEIVIGRSKATIGFEIVLFFPAILCAVYFRKTRKKFLSF
ncbi:MAG: hypothetical protein ACTSW1_10545, partial [Candidatus Hodarchaeales archaeon]